ncbi:hypothetical protein SAMN05192539_100799 [Paraburkholderia diazotrophica]|uniref:Class II glutamine amidotransferase n=1 Tax=Paraburkholderia diazotrophica TaxID=667676 RepID=A0A1H6WKK4_9BURK|nr:hypothetical protein SAMN05192539_100799 [Paraburkholderia diazotrophica]
MCRWLAYRGSPIQLEAVLLGAKHSLIDQNLRGKPGCAAGICLPLSREGVPP